MINEFLKNAYKLKVVNPQILNHNLKNWDVAQNHLRKTFTFGSFQQAMTFMSLASQYAEDHQIIANV